MRFKLSDKRPDDINDELGAMLRRLRGMGPWTRNKHSLYWQIEEAALEAGYTPFTGDYRDYFLERKGDSALFDVGPGRSGILRYFESTRVRLICAGAWDGYAGRYFLIGVPTV